jgi:hypothetical protein
MPRASAKPPAKAEPVTAKTEKAEPVAAKAEAAPAKDNPGRDLLELRLRWKIVNEMVEAGIAERKRLREAIDSLAKETQHSKGAG